MFECTGTAEGKEAYAREESVDAEADGGAVGDFFPFEVVLGRAAVEDVAAAAPEQDAAAVYFSEEEEEDDGGCE